MRGDSIWELWKVKSTRQMGEEDWKSSSYPTDSLPFSRSVIFQSKTMQADTQNWEPRIRQRSLRRSLLLLPWGAGVQTFLLLFVDFTQSHSGPKLTIRWRTYETGMPKAANSLKVGLTWASGPCGLNLTRSIASQTKHVNVLHRI